MAQPPFAPAELRVARAAHAERSLLRSRRAGLLCFFMPSPPSQQAPGPWLREAGRRLLVCWPVKFAGTAAGMTVFFALYFWLLAHPLRAVTVLPVTWID